MRMQEYMQDQATFSLLYAYLPDNVQWKTIHFYCNEPQP